MTTQTKRNRFRCRLGLALTLGAAGCSGAAPTDVAEEQSSILGVADDSADALAAPPARVPLDPTTIPQFAEPLPVPPVYKPHVERDRWGRISHEYDVHVREFQEQILPSGFPQTRVLGYAGFVFGGKDGERFFQGSPGATFVATRFVPIHVRWHNDLGARRALLPVDPTIDWANPLGLSPPTPPFPPFPPGFPQAQRPIPIVTHLHGGEDAPDSDGGPLQWFTSSGITGPGFVTRRYTYPNQQPPTTLFYHDHALGLTRINVESGLAGFYLLRDPFDRIAPLLPSGPFDVGLAIQDRSFYSDGSLAYASVGPNPEVHPYWTPEFFGDTIMVNGKVWPNLDVEPRGYRFRVVNGSNARFYNLSLSNGQPMIQIGGDGGYLPAPVTLTHILVAPGERVDLLVDFSPLPNGTRIQLVNDAPAPFPTGDAPDPGTTGRILQLTVVAGCRQPLAQLPHVLNKLPTLRPNRPERVLTLNEVEGPGGPLAVLLDGQPFSAPVSELPEVGSTEEWEIVNMTADTHPIHLHLVQFQAKNRQAFDVDRYRQDWTALNGAPPLDHPTVRLDPAPYLLGPAIPPDANEDGWKDTLRMNPGEVTRILVRFAPTSAKHVRPGENLFPFDPTGAPGYVWHCHILEHEDNEMMRPYELQP